jgi:hypothetical protein
MLDNSKIEEFSAGMKCVTYPGKEYTTWFQVQIHEIKRDATLQVPVNAADGDLVPDVDYFEV